MKFKISQFLNLRLMALGISLFLVNCWANPLTHPPIECLMKQSNFLCPEKDPFRSFAPAQYLLLLPESSVTISNLTNHSIVETGFVVGTVPQGPTFVNVGIDDAPPTQVPVINGTWRYGLPAKAITGTFWTYGTLHTIYAHLPYERSNTIQVRMGTNHDTDGDGYPDLIVSATPNNSTQGYGYVYKSNPNTKRLDTTPNTVLTNGLANNYFGSRIGSGDFNGDGYADILIGAQAYNAAIGRAYEFLSRGQSGIPSQNLNTGGTADAILDGVTDSGRFGTNIIGADVNADGYDDAIFASPWENELFIFHSQGQNAISSQSTNKANFVFKNPSPPNPDDNFGTYAYAGDVNGDGFLDLVVSAATYSTIVGRIYIFISNQGSLPATPQQILIAPLESAPGCATGLGCQFGTSFVMDYFNSDRCIDLAVGGPQFNTRQGIVFVYHSNCDPINPYPNPPVATLVGPPTTSCNANNCFFGGTLASGDTNGDGLPDLLIGATGASAGIGDVYLVLNDPISGFRNMDLSAGGSADSLFSGSLANRNFSQGLQFQDTNADGLQDIIISEPLTTNQLYTFHSIRGGVPTNQNLNGGGVTSQTLTPPAGTSLGNTIALWKTKAENYFGAMVVKTKEYFGFI
ncbi:FG-GAP-like repeat-containing protein [Leptospira meyeri]|uniref:FG-GAP-like repeat-containing protein n=1 Tax=Leptospira meyeri TaxID=29508 RepID=UPI001FEDA2AE|nr:FG-GAP-like repeat-containing protein [Leptospira meyeri]